MEVPGYAQEFETRRQEPHDSGWFACAYDKVDRLVHQYPKTAVGIGLIGLGAACAVAPVRALLCKTQAVEAADALARESTAAVAQTVKQSTEFAAGALDNPALAGTGRDFSFLQVASSPQPFFQSGLSARPGGLLAQIATPVRTATDLTKVPELWLPKRMFGSREELFAEAGFPGMEQAELVKPGRIDRFVRGVRTPMAGWVQDYSDRTPFMNMLLRAAGAAEDPEEVAILQGRTAEINEAVNNFARQEKLVEVPVVRKPELSGIRAALRTRDGTMLITDNVTMFAPNSGEAHEFVGAVAHEYQHGNQLDLIIRRLARLKGVDGSSQEGCVKVAEEFEKLKGSPLDVKLVERILKSNPEALTAEESQRADTFLQGFGIGQKDQSIAMHHFMNVHNNLQQLEDGSLSADRFIQLAAHESSFTETNLGSPTLTPRLAKLKIAIDRGDRNAIPHTLAELKPLMTAQLHALNRQIQANYTAYMQMHEKEALLVGELARLRSIELGPMTKAML